MYFGSKALFIYYPLYRVFSQKIISCTEYSGNNTYVGITVYYHSKHLDIYIISLVITIKFKRSLMTNYEMPVNN